MAAVCLSMRFAQSFHNAGITSKFQRKVHENREKITVSCRFFATLGLPIAGRKMSKAPRPFTIHGPSRRAAALVELAICLPLVAFLVGASMEACDLIFLRNSLTAACYAGTLEVSRVGCTELRVRDQIEQILTASKVKDCTISIAGLSGQPFSQTVRGDQVRIEAVAVAASNLRMGRFIPTSASQITVTAIALR
jgi:hypothetical protein